MKVQIRESWEGFGIEILFYEERGGKIFVAEPMEFVMKELPADGTYQKPSLFISHVIQQDFLKNLAEVLDNIGVKTEKDAKIQGLLEATKYHLEDMRKLVFK